MHNSAWAALLRHIPEEQHNRFTIITANGTEISVQTLLRIEADLVMFKGRLSGSQDAGRVFIVPFQNIDSISTTQPIKESEFNEIFGTLVIPDQQPAKPDSSPEIAIPPADPTPTPVPPTSGTGPRAVRSEVLERFRSRSNGPSSSGNLFRPNDE